MILSKQNLEAVRVTKKDSKIPALDNIHITPDGATVGIGGNMMIVVAPVKPELKRKLRTILPETTVASGKAFTVRSESVLKTLKMLPSDKQFAGLREHVDLVEDQQGGCRFNFTDGKEQYNLHVKLYPREYLPYHLLLEKVLQTCSTEEPEKGNKRIVLDMTRFSLLLEAMRTIAQDTTGAAPVYVEFTHDGYIIIRGINMVNGQRVFGVMTPIPGSEGKWLGLGEWEKNYLESKTTVKRVLMTKRKVMHKLK